MAGFYRYNSDDGQEISSRVVQEIPLAIFINNRELVTLLCTPEKLDCLVIGFLYLEGIIKGIDDILHLRICEKDGLARVYLRYEPDPSLKRIYTSGCGKGISFITPVSTFSLPQDGVEIYPHQVHHLMQELYAAAKLYQAFGGVHAAALSDGRRLLISAEDIGRHNTLDKIQGESLMRKIPTEGRILITTGRISSEMVQKAARMQVPILISRTSPTSLAVQLAESFGITLIGYARGSFLNIYAHAERVKGPGRPFPIDNTCY